MARNVGQPSGPRLSVIGTVVQVCAGSPAPSQLPHSRTLRNTGLASPVW
ncbi:hypothetical protein [Phytohabitans rumicis]|nr:hypothetical protein [Phytohabitans rumicis]